MSAGDRPSLRAGCVERCPGCAHRGLAEGDSLGRKQDWLRARLAPWAERLEPVRATAGEARWGYREKTCLRAEWDARAGRWKLGLSAPVADPAAIADARRPWEREYEVIDIPGCPVHSPRLRRLLAELAKALPGPERLPLAFVAVSGTLVTLVAKAAPGEALAEAARAIVAPRGPLDPGRAGISGLWLNANPSAGERVFSSRGWAPIWGEREARWGGEDARPGDEGLAHGPESFLQLIPELYRAALERASAFLEPGPGSAVIDLCSGIGASLRLWRGAGADALGVELSGEAARCAALNAGEGRSLRGRASERIPQLARWLAESGARRTLAFANPPRLGLEPEVVDWLGREARPERIAYLSCSAGTLARDLAALECAGYRVVGLAPYDFFPQTPHVETLAMLELDSKGERRQPGPC